MGTSERAEQTEDKAYEATCMNCRTRLRFKRSEAKPVTGQRDRDIHKVTCPGCDSHVFVSVPPS